MQKFAIIVAGGSGSRMENSVPKQFIEVNGKPVLMHTLNVFEKFDSEINLILVLPKNQVDYWSDLCQQHNFKVKYNLTFGGKNRFQSVKNGLEKITDEGIVFIHDGVRPLVSVETLKNCYSTALEKGNALPVVPVTESIRFAEKDESKAVDRSKYYLVQTPQTFKVSQIKKAYKNALSEDFTDDASVLEADGEKIQLVEGNRENIKITFQSDLDIASVLLKNNN